MNILAPPQHAGIGRTAFPGDDRIGRGDDGAKRGKLLHHSRQVAPCRWALRGGIVPLAVLAEPPPEQAVASLHDTKKRTGPQIVTITPKHGTGLQIPVPSRQSLFVVVAVHKKRNRRIAEPRLLPFKFLIGFGRVAISLRPMRIPGASVICVAPRGHHDRMVRIEAADEVRKSGKPVRGDKLPRYLRLII